MSDATPEQDGIHRIPDDLLPEGVSGASWDPVVLRASAEAHCRHPFDHTMEVKAWVVLHLLNALDESLNMLRELEARRTCLVAARDDFEAISRAKTEDGGLWVRSVAEARIPYIEQAIANTDALIGDPDADDEDIPS